MSKLNLAKALKYKAIPDFTELNENFSDLDGIHYGDTFNVIIEEKFIWNEGEDPVKNKMVKFANQCMLPTLVLFTKNPKDIGPLPMEQKVINLADSKVVDFYCNKQCFGWVIPEPEQNPERPLYGFKGVKSINFFTSIFKEWVNGGCIDPQVKIFDNLLF